MIYEYDCDTELPSNLFDEDFGPDTTVMPPGRPSDEPTPISYMNCKVKLCLELGHILQATSRIKDQVHYDEILRFDARLRELKTEMPPHLKLQPLDGSHAPMTLVIARYNLDILSLKIMCLLHRKYMSRARQNPRYAHSRRSAIEASLDTLRHLETLHRESQPNGRLHAIKWFVTSIATRDFLLPAMLILLELHFDSSGDTSTERRESHTRHFWTREQRLEMIRYLELTREIWSGLGHTSMEAVKATSILDIMLAKIKRPSGEPVIATNHPLFPGSDDMHPEHSAAMTLGMLSGGVSPSPNTATTVFDAVRSPGGTVYPAFDLGGHGNNVNSIGSSGGSGSGMTPDFSGAGGDLLFGGGDPGAGPASPFTSMFGSMGGGVGGGVGGANMDFTSGLDWVRPPPCFMPGGWTLTDTT